MRLFDVLTPVEYERLNSGLPATADPEDADIVDFPFQYGWLGNQLREHVGEPGTEYLMYPRIAFCPDLGRGMPEIRWIVREGTRMVRKTFHVVEFELPEEQVLLFDDTMWVCALNNSPVPESEAEEKLLVSSEAKTKSWERMFNMSFPDPNSEYFDPDYWDTLENKYLCGAYWQLTLDLVKRSSMHHGKVKNPQRIFYPETQ